MRINVHKIRKHHTFCEQLQHWIILTQWRTDDVDIEGKFNVTKLYRTDRFFENTD